jgi:hypothetical protein
MSSSVDRQKSKPPGTRRTVTGTLNSMATRRIRFFMVTGLTPDGRFIRAAVLDREEILFLSALYKIGSILGPRPILRASSNGTSSNSIASLRSSILRASYHIYKTIRLSLYLITSHPTITLLGFASEMIGAVIILF